MLDTAVLDALPLAVYVTDVQGRITYYNRAAAELWGREPKLNSDRWCGFVAAFHLDGSPVPFEESPLAEALKGGKPTQGLLLIAEREEGTRVPYMPAPSAVLDEDGRITGAVNVLMDVSDRQRADQAAAQLAAIVTDSDDAILSKSLDGTILSWNAGARRIFGYESAEMVGQHITKIIPPELHDEETRILAQLSRGERVDHYETVRVSKDGRRLHISLTVSPVRDQSGRVVGASKIARDITERKRNEEMQALLVNELNHRVKNSLATVQAIANQTLRHSASREDFVSSFNRRIQALARAHGILLRQKLQSASLADLVREQVQLDGFDRRITCEGPPVELDPDAALQLGLVLHELSSNARKYGALSVPDGRVSVRWEMTTDNGRRLLLRWRESGGPRVNPPISRGFGSQLIEKGLAAHGGQVELTFQPEGARCDIAIPLSDSRQEARSGDPQVPHESSAAPHRADDIRGKRILVVEDEIIIALDVVDKLAERGCQVVGPAATYEEAQRLIAEDAFDCALLDANLAGRGVDELAAALTQRNTPFAFVTGYGREALPLAFRDAPMIAKPFSAQQLYDLIEHIFVRQGETIALRQKA